MQFDTVVNYMGCNYEDVDNFDEAFDKQHLDQQQQHFDVNMEMGKAREDVEETASLNQPG